MFGDGCVGGQMSVGPLQGTMATSWSNTLGTFLNLLCLCGEVDSCLGLALAFFWLTSWSLFLVADAWGPLLPSWDMSGLEEDWGWWCCLHPCMLLLFGRAVVAELLWQSRPHSSKNLASNKWSLQDVIAYANFAFLALGYTVPHSGLPVLTSVDVFGSVW